MRRPVQWAGESHTALRRDKVIGRWAERFGPPSLFLSDDLFKNLAAAIVSQQLSGRAAETIFSRLEKVVHPIESKTVKKAGLERIRSAGLSGNKAKSLLALADAAENNLDLHSLRETPDEDVIERLCEVCGVGRWTAEMFLIFSLGRPDVMSAGDLGLRKGLQLVYELEDLPEPVQCEGLFARWSPWRSAASWYLWEAVAPGR